MRTRARGGYSLLELLIVVGIISVLAGILLPAYAQARRKSREAVCTSNLRQLVGAWNMYYQDHEIPPYSLRLLDGPYIRSDAVHYCSADPDPWGQVGTMLRMCAVNDGLDPNAVQPYPDSYNYLSSVGYPLTGARWLELVETTPSAGILVRQCHGQVWVSGMDAMPSRLTGLVLRARPDGAVVRQVVERRVREGGRRLGNLLWHGSTEPDWYAGDPGYSE